MGSRIFFFAALCTTIITTGLFASKISQIRDDQDEINDAVRDIRTELLQNNAAAALQNFGLENETLLRIKYGLAPAYLCMANYLTDRRYDTMLSTFPGSIRDSLRDSVLSGRIIIMERRDRSNIYVLTKKAPR